MAITNSTDKSVSDASPDHDPRMSYIPLGEDTRGHHHVAQTATDTVHVVHPDGTRQRRHLDAGDVDDYFEAVADAIGWHRPAYGLNLVELADARGLLPRPEADR